MKVPIVQLSLPDDVLDEVKTALKNGMWAEGKPVRDLEKEFAEYCKVKFCRAVNNGTNALISILACMELSPGDEIICPSFTFIATSNSMTLFGIKPVFADIDPKTYNISPDSIRKKITKKTKGIMTVDLFGLCANYDDILKIAKENKLAVIEDACQAHGAELNGKKTGSFGIASGFSLYPTKNMFCGGEGGLITTNDEDLYKKMDRFVNHGQSEKYVHPEIGFNMRLQSSNGIIARYSLKNLDKNNAKRIENAKLLNDLLSNIKGITIPTCGSNYKHVYHQYTIRSDKRDKLADELAKNDIGFGIHYKIPIHKQMLYKELGYNDKLPETEKASNEVISLPVHPALSEDQIRFVADIITKFQTK
jgi:perosamine synthetase